MNAIPYKLYYVRYVPGGGGGGQEEAPSYPPGGGIGSYEDGPAPVNCCDPEYK